VETPLTVTHRRTSRRCGCDRSCAATCRQRCSRRWQPCLQTAPSLCPRPRCSGCATSQPLMCCWLSPLATQAQAVALSQWVVLPLLGAAGGASSVDSGLQALLASPAGKSVAAEISLLVAAAVKRACADAGAASSGLLGSCPAGLAPLAISDPATQLQAAPTPSASPGTDGDALGSRSVAEAGPQGGFHAGLRCPRHGQLWSVLSGRVGGPDLRGTGFQDGNPHTLTSHRLIRPFFYVRPFPCSAVGAIGGAAGGALVLVGAGVAAALLYRKRKRQAELRKRSGKLAMAGVPSLHGIDAAAGPALDATSPSKLVPAGKGNELEGPGRKAKWGVRGASTRYLLRASSRVHAAAGEDADAGAMAGLGALISEVPTAAPTSTDAGSNSGGTAALAAVLIAAASPAPQVDAAGAETARPLCDADLDALAQPLLDANASGKPQWADRTGLETPRGATDAAALSFAAAAADAAALSFAAAAASVAETDVEGSVANPLLAAAAIDCSHTVPTQQDPATDPRAVPAAGESAAAVVASGAPGQATSPAKPDLSLLRPPSKSRLRVASPADAAAGVTGTLAGRRAASVKLMRAAATASSAAAYMAKGQPAPTLSSEDAAGAAEPITAAVGGTDVFSSAAAGSNGASENPALAAAAVPTAAVSASKPQPSPERAVRAASGWSRRNLLTARLEAEAAAATLTAASGRGATPASARLADEPSDAIPEARRSRGVTPAAGAPTGAAATAAAVPESEADLLLRELSSADLLADMHTARPAGARVPLEAIPEGDATAETVPSAGEARRSSAKASTPVTPSRGPSAASAALRTKSTLRLLSPHTPATEPQRTPTDAFASVGATTHTADADRGFAAAPIGAAPPPRLQSSNRHISMRALVTDAGDAAEAHGGALAPIAAPPGAPMQAAAVCGAAAPDSARTVPRSSAASSTAAAAAVGAGLGADAPAPASDSAAAGRISRVRSSRSALVLVSPGGAAGGR